MSTQKHTQGPWRANFATTDKGLKVCQILGHTTKTSGIVVADLSVVGIDGMKGIGAYDKESIANAHLIAAAPALLEACKGMLEWARRVEEKNPGMEVAQAVNAIAQAEGEL